MAPKTSTKLGKRDHKTIIKEFDREIHVKANSVHWRKKTVEESIQNLADVENRLRGFRAAKVVLETVQHDQTVQPLPSSEDLTAAEKFLAEQVKRYEYVVQREEEWIEQNKRTILSAEKAIVVAQKMVKKYTKALVIIQNMADQS